MFVAYLVQKLNGKREKPVEEFEDEESDDDDEQEKVDPKLKRQFESAASHFATIVSKVPKEVALELYGIYKRATSGPADPNSKPNWYEQAARLKYDAWTKHSHLTREDALKKYCDILKGIDPSWDPSQAAASGTWGNRPSRMADIEPELLGDMFIVENVKMETPIQKEWFAAMRNDDVATMKKLLKKDPDLLEAKDQHLAMTALTRAIDQGCEKVAQFLIASGADVNVVDQQGQTPLHFAAQCHRMRLSEQLMAAGANKNARDVDGKTPAECCDDPALRSLLRSY
ncbi:unnamed protein product [Caenorhabditis bovis]|uniref:Acyl-CoA-binding domain-containing protein 6 n=1 Tax=Caenorhabditis bovis TaxID=2654633 RepID=A0A8S1ES82_9PELO|nr:unnamed protein product [Caenorhabditis bovis]